MSKEKTLSDKMMGKINGSHHIRWPNDDSKNEMDLDFNPLLFSEDVKDTIKAIKADIIKRFHNQEVIDIINKRVGNRLR